MKLNIKSKLKQLFRKNKKSTTKCYGDIRLTQYSKNPSSYSFYSMNEIHYNDQNAVFLRHKSQKKLLIYIRKHNGLTDKAYFSIKFKESNLYGDIIRNTTSSLRFKKLALIFKHPPCQM